MDATFKALADPTRRQLLDRLRAENGQTLRQLGEQVGMTRQALTQHLDLLVEANLVAVVRRGRERLHYLNPAPIHDLRKRWIAEFDEPRLDALDQIKHRAEESTMVPDYVYVTYINATPSDVWRALTDADLTAAYWGHRNVSDWQPGSTWEHQRLDGSGIDITGTVLEADPPHRMVMTFEDPTKEAADRTPSTVTFDVTPYEEIVRLTVTHEQLPDAEMRAGIAQGWPAVLANLKSLLETGSTLPQDPWDMAAAPA